MREDIKVTLGVNATPEGVALALLQLIASTESKPFDGENPDRKWILDTFAECRAAVRGEKYQPD